MHRSSPIVFERISKRCGRDRSLRALFVTLTALAMGVVALPSSAVALDCDAAAFQDIEIPNPASPGLTGWDPVGGPLLGTPPLPLESTPQLASGDHNVGVAEGQAELFVQEVNGALCLYLRRSFLDEITKEHAGTANGILCFDKDTCEVCAWDIKTGATVDPAGIKVSDPEMEDPSDYNEAGESIDDCSGCHLVGAAVDWVTSSISPE